MKAKLFFMIATAIIFQSTAAVAVENPVVDVDKPFQHELICRASSESGNFEFVLQWSVNYMHIPDGRAPLIKKEFSYELKNLGTNAVLNDHFGNFFNGHAEIKTGDSGLSVFGDFFMYKRLGYIHKNTEIILTKDGEGQIHLNSFVNKAIETFENPKDYCNPPTRLCGSEPPLKSPKIVFSQIFTNSSCEIVK